MQPQNKSLAERIIDGWRNLSLAGKLLVGATAFVWITWLVQTAFSQSQPAQDQPTQINPPTPVENGSNNETNRLTGTTVFEIDSERSVASYAAVEEFFGDSGLIVGRNTNQGLNTAVGETRAISGLFALDLEKGSPKILEGEFTADLSQLTSVQPHRDSMLKRFWLESNDFPTATFQITEIPTLPPSYTEGTPAAFPLTGILTVRGIEKEVTFDVVASLQGDTLEALAVTSLLFEDFEISPPSMAGVLKVEPDFKLIVSITAVADTP